MENQTFPIISGVSIRVSDDGKISLNDLHKASGGHAKHRPHYWLESEKTKEFIAAEQEKEGKSQVSVARGGSSPGTYVSRMVAYDYAAWISPDFKGQVYRTFDAVGRGDFNAALTEHQRAKIAFYEDAKKNKAMRIPERTCDFQIAYIRGDQATLDRIEREEQAEKEWRENTLPGQVEAQLEFMKGPGYEGIFRLPPGVSAAEARSEIEAFGRRKKLRLQIEEWGLQQFRIESLY